MAETLDPANRLAFTNNKRAHIPIKLTHLAWVWHEINPQIQLQGLFAASGVEEQGYTYEYICAGMHAGNQSCWPTRFYLLSFIQELKFQCSKIYLPYCIKQFKQINIHYGHIYTNLLFASRHYDGWMSQPRSPNNGTWKTSQLKMFPTSEIPSHRRQLKWARTFHFYLEEDLFFTPVFYSRIHVICVKSSVLQIIRKPSTDQRKEEISVIC